MESIYLVNKNGVLFDIRQDVNVENLEKAGCLVFQHLSAAYDHLVDLGFDLDDVEDIEYIIENNTCDCRNDFIETIIVSLEEYISSYSVV